MYRYTLIFMSAGYCNLYNVWYHSTKELLLFHKTTNTAAVISHSVFFWEYTLQAKTFLTFYLGLSCV